MKELINIKIRNFGCSSNPSAPYLRATANIWPKPKSWQERNAQILQETHNIGKEKEFKKLGKKFTSNFGPAVTEKNVVQL